ncbi:MAG TPA: hypothetical protein VJ882_07525 [Desulfuromonadales bacterium]|nr:hypothetical protein [Desulfuromonadales bacterium]
MKESTDQILVRWRKIVLRVRSEMDRIDRRERLWMSARFAEIAGVQVRMHELFLRAGGSGQCQQCQGQCCECGRNHFALVNLLGYLLQGQNPPEPDFDLPCSFLGEGGCRLDVARRPFACVTFVCGVVEEGMGMADREAFYNEEARLRRLYEQFDRRYALSSSRGILIRSARLGDEPFLLPIQA